MTDRLRPSPDVILTELGDGTGVLLHVGTKFYFTLNATGVTVWKTLTQEKDVGVTSAGLAEALVRLHQVELEVAAADLAPLIAELVAEGLGARAR